jgi:hypothetical protein
MIPKTKYKLTYKLYPGKGWLVNADFKEVPPQKRMVIDQKWNESKTKMINGRSYVAFPFLQFYFFEFYPIGENEAVEPEKSTGFMVSGSEKSIFEGGQRMSLRLPNCSSFGNVCLGGQPFTNLNDGITVWWHTAFEGYCFEDMLYEAAKESSGRADWFYPQLLNEKYESKQYIWEVTDE